MLTRPLSALLLCLAGSTVFVSLAVGAGQPPVIREPWTPLPCPTHPSSTLEFEGCLERTVARSDRRIDAKAATNVRLLRQSDRAAFVEGEHAWLRYRRRSCSATASVYRGGSAEPLAFLRCEQNRNTRHLADLLGTERALRQRGTAPGAGGRPPRYHICGRVSLGFAATPVYAHNVSCTVAVAVAKGCSASRRGGCFGQFPLPYNGVGEPYLPQAPLFKPRGFECYQVVPPYTVGLPPPSNKLPDPKWILCHRQASRPGPNPVIDQQLVAYAV